MDDATWPNPNQWLVDDVRTAVERQDEQTCREWGGVWANDTCHVRPLPIDADHTEQTRVRSAKDGLDAFEKYTGFFEYVIEQYEPSSDAAVLVPCGSMKPIGRSSIHQKKLTALQQSGFLSRCDLHILSEPCTIIPHGMRLSVPAVNYDFPPKYTEQDRAPEVFEIFVDRLAEWIEEMPYETIYPYLVKRHQAKFDAALERVDANPTVVTIPGASSNIEKLVDEGESAYSGDQFKSVEDLVAKLEFVRELKDRNDQSYVAEYPAAVRQFYQNREEYQPV